MACYNVGVDGLMPVLNTNSMSQGPLKQPEGTCGHADYDLDSAYLKILVRCKVGQNKV